MRQRKWKSEKRRELQDRALRDAEKDVQMKKLKGLEALRRTRPSPGSVSRDGLVTKNGGKKNDRSEERTGARNDADTGKKKPGVEVADAECSKHGSGGPLATDVL
uniref:Uncharacterized protein n=1 Tax=Photinus pyralis TaxID=7054 RepID=A0A1Y1KDL1_PHOPY